MIETKLELLKKIEYSGEQDGPIDATDARYRDWDILKYWFRGVEKYAPWVNKVYLLHVDKLLNG